MDTSGVYEMTPKSHDVFSYRETIEVGEVANETIVWNALHKLMKKYRTNKYDMLKMNCNHFSNEFLLLLIGRGLPHYLNRAANVGSYFHCIVPRRFLVVVPPEAGLDKNWDVVNTSLSNDGKSTNYESQRINDDSSQNNEDDEDSEDYGELFEEEDESDDLIQEEPLEKKGRMDNSVLFSDKPKLGSLRKKR